jgi:CheY-like chemotaxis protein/predicted regulator of Ras-like GTPase activity (Roadblock/LC7/MglB family)
MNGVIFLIAITTHRYLLTIIKEYYLVSQYSILIADSDPNDTELLSEELMENGFEVTVVSSGGDALEFYQKESPDVVLTDLVLPDMDGMQLLAVLKQFDPQSKVIITTAQGDKDAVARAFRMGAIEFLDKPLDPQFLVSKIRDLLAREDLALEGDLQLMSLASIIQINCEERNQAQLILNLQGEEGIIYFNEGEMIHAEAGDLSGDEAIYTLLSWESGSFRLKMDAEPPERTIHKGWSALLLEGMRRIDETTAGWSPEWEEEVDQPDTVPEDHIQERKVKALSNIRDVQSVVILGLDGIVIAQEKSKDPEVEGVLGEFIQDKAELINGFLDGGGLERAVLSGSDKRIFLQPLGETLILLTLTIRSSVETVWDSVQTINRRYRSV